MFTGIILATGRVAAAAPRDGDLELAIEAGSLGPGRIAVGDSISVQGVCLTATRIENGVFHADVSRETLDKTTLGRLAPGRRVNLEPSLRAGDPLGGHLVSGHIDGVGAVTSISEDARSWRLQFELPQALMRYVAPKGSICIDGVSLTVNEVGGARLDVNVIPHTRAVTTLGELAAGDRVNVEIDVIARYLDRLAQTYADFRKT
ncbi:MAG TPA: riboflavin synthase [Steroidobacteraceae bacterium]|nr:riboflavin synthase [Steroidobacteraceae bacterium]